LFGLYGGDEVILYTVKVGKTPAVPQEQAQGFCLVFLLHGQSEGAGDFILRFQSRLDIVGEVLDDFIHVHLVHFPYQAKLIPLISEEIGGKELIKEDFLYFSLYFAFFPN